MTVGIPGQRLFCALFHDGLVWLEVSAADGERLGPPPLLGSMGPWRYAPLPGPWSVLQWVLTCGPYTTASQVRHCQLVCPPPP